MGPPVCSRLSPRAGVRRRGQDHTDVPRPHMTNILLHEESRLLTAGPQGDRTEAPSERRPPRANSSSVQNSDTPPFPVKHSSVASPVLVRAPAAGLTDNQDYPDTSATQVRSRPSPGGQAAAAEHRQQRPVAAVPSSAVSSLFPVAGSGTVPSPSGAHLSGLPAGLRWAPRLVPSETGSGLVPPHYTANFLPEGAVGSAGGQGTPLGRPPPARRSQGRGDAGGGQELLPLVQSDA